MRNLVFALLALASAAPALGAGDLSRQDPIEVVVELGRPGTHAFFPHRIELETGKLYKLVLTNKSDAPHYFTSHDFSQRVFTRKVQVVSAAPEKAVWRSSRAPSATSRSTRDRPPSGGSCRSRPGT